MNRRHVLLVGGIASCGLLGAGLLVARVASLESRLAALESRSHVVHLPNPLMVTPGVPETAAPPSIPEAWSRREFNGQTVYVVPLAGE